MEDVLRIICYCDGLDVMFFLKLVYHYFLHLDMRICCVTSPRGLHHVEYLEHLNLDQKRLPTWWSMLKVVEESHDSTDKDSISSQGAHARPYLSHSMSMLEYEQINVTMWGWHELMAFENLFDSPHVPSHPILFASTQFPFFSSWCLSGMAGQVMEMDKGSENLGEELVKQATWCQRLQYCGVITHCHS